MPLLGQQPLSLCPVPHHDKDDVLAVLQSFGGA